MSDARACAALESVLLVACFVVLLGGAVFASSYFEPGSAMAWVVTVVVVVAMAASSCGCGGGEMRRGLRAAGRREAALAIMSAHAAPAGLPAAASAVAAKTPRLSRANLLERRGNPMRAAGPVATGNNGDDNVVEMLQQQAQLQQVSRTASSWALARGAVAYARDPRVATAVVRLQAAARRRGALRVVHERAAEFYFRVLDDDSGEYYYLNSRTGGTAWEKPRLLRDARDAAVYA